MRNLKKILALVLALVMSFSVMSVAGAAYADQDAVDASAYKTAIEVLSAVKVFEGDDNGFRPNDTITRGEVATIIYRIHSLDTEKALVDFYKDYVTSFKDLDWSAAYVNYCYKEGLVKGYNDTTFAPKDEVTGYQVLAMILRAIGYDAQGEFTGSNWKTEVAVRATKLGLLKGIKAAELGVPATRALVAELVFRTMALEKVALNKETGVYVGLETSINADFELNTIVNEKDVDEWGRVTYTNGWYLADGSWNNLVTEAEKPLATFTDVVKVADVKAVNEKLVKDGTKFDIYVDGVKIADKFDTTDAKDTVGGKGITVELYKDRVVVIKTHLVEITKVDTKKGETTYNLDGVAVETAVKTTAFEKGAFLLVNINSKGIDWDNAKAVTPEKVTFNRVTEDALYIAGVKVVEYAEMLNLTGAALVKNTEYNVIKDEAGNVVAVLKYEAPKTEDTTTTEAPVYVVVLATQYMTGAQGGFGEANAADKTMARVQFLTETAARNVEIAGYYSETAKDGYVKFVKDTAAIGLTFGATYDNKTPFYANLYQVKKTLDNGALVLDLVETTAVADVTFTKGAINKVAGQYVDANTTYVVVDTAKGTAKAVVGYNNIETIKATDALVVNGEKYVELVYVYGVEAEEEVAPKVTSEEKYYFMTSGADVDWTTKALSGLVDLKTGAAYTLDGTKVVAKDVYNTLVEMVDLYKGTVLTVKFIYTDGVHTSTEIASVMTGANAIADGKSILKVGYVEYFTTTTMSVRAATTVPSYEIDGNNLFVGDVLYRMDKAVFVNEKGEAIELADLTGKEHLYVVYSEDANGQKFAVTVTVTSITEKVLNKRFVDVLTAEKIADSLSAASLTYTNGKDTEAEFITNLTYAIQDSALLKSLKLTEDDITIVMTKDENGKVTAGTVTIEFAKYVDEKVGDEIVSVLKEMKFEIKLTVK